MRRYSWFKHCEDLKLTYFQHMKLSVSFANEFTIGSNRACGDSCVIRYELHTMI